MKKIIKYIGWGVFSVALCWGAYQAAAFGAAKWELHRVRQIDLQATEYLEKSLPSLFSNLDEEQMAAYLDPALFSDEESYRTLKKALTAWKQLGPFQKIIKIDFIKLIPNFDQTLFYTVEMQFQKGNTQITAVVEKKDGSWFYRYLNVDLSTIAKPFM